MEAGINALIAAKPPEGSPAEFSSAMVRYIDAFRDNLREGDSNYSFMKNKLQTSVQLPPGLLDLAESEDMIVPTMAVRFPVKEKDNSQLTLQVAAGQVNKEQATVMDMIFFTNRKIGIAIAEILEVLDLSQKTLHSVFEMMTSQIKESMGPVTGG